jgi:hypothetical protein
MPKHPRKKWIQKPPPTPKKKRNQNIWEISEEDLPRVGEVWRHRSPLYDGWAAEHFLLLREGDDEFFKRGDNTFLMLCLETGETRMRYMNFQLDDWERVA